MSESRKSDGDMEEDLESCSLASVTLERTHGEKNHSIRKKKKGKKEEVTVQKAGVKPYLSPSSSSNSKKLPGSDGTWKPEKCVNARTHSQAIRDLVAISFKRGLICS